MNGLLLIDKPRGPSSFEVVKKVRDATGVQRVGHTGTLDPDASGLLGVALGRCTKLAQFLVMNEKVYTFEIVFGTRTDTDDATGKVVESSSAEHVGRSEVEQILDDFSGAIDQVPPDFSAVHIDGKRAYELARKGTEVDIPSRTVHIHDIELHEFSAADRIARLRVRCGSGTYVRSLARDIGVRLDTAAHARAIRRVSVGSFDISRALPLDEVSLESAADAKLTPAEMVSSLPSVVYGPERARALGLGQRIITQKSELVGDWDDDPIGRPVAVIDEEGELVGVAIIERQDRTDVLLKPKKILKPAYGRR